MILPFDLKNLIELDRITQEISRLTDEIAQLPKLVAAIENKLAVARSHFKSATNMWTTETDYGFSIDGGVGFVLRSPWFTGWGGTIGYDFAYSPALTNDIGDKHASGGHRFHMSFGASF